MEPSPEQLVDRKYRLVRLLAEGGMGSIWVASHERLGTQVVVKFMGGKLASTQQARRRFEREAKAAAHLNSPHVVRVFDYGVDDNTPYIVMELLEGEDLQTRLARERRLPLHETVRLLSQVARGLAAAHAAGIVHRDLKPSNLFVTTVGDEEVVKILDFGVAKADSLDDTLDRTASGVLVGSPLWMSPEQARSQPVDHRSDLWSLGVVAFALLTGRHLFRGKEMVDTALRVCTDPIPKASSLRPELPTAVDTFFTRALARPVGARFQSAEEMATALADLTSLPQPLSRHTESLVPTPTSSADEVRGETPGPAPSVRDDSLMTTEAPSRARGRRGARWALLALALTGTTAIGFVARSQLDPGAAPEPSASLALPPAQEPPALESAPPPMPSAQRATPSSPSPVLSARPSPPRVSPPAKRAPRSSPTSKPGAQPHPVFGI
ncbi:MAG: protein kinase [Polyangiaceae bacterium]